MKREPEDHSANEPQEEGQGVDRRTLIRGGITGLTVLGSGALGGAALAIEPKREMLVLRHEDLRTSVAAVFGSANQDRKVRQMLIQDPSRLILEAILPEGTTLPPQRVSEANRFLFSVLANDGFRKWATEYQSKLPADAISGQVDRRRVDKMAIAQDVAAAFGRYGDKNLIISLANQTTLQGAEYLQAAEVEVTIETYIAVAAVLILVIVLIDFSLVDTSALNGQLTPSEFRGIADQLVNQAKLKMEAGELMNAKAIIR